MIAGQALSRAARGAIPVALALGVGALLLLGAGANPVRALADIWDGSFGSGSKIAGTLMAWVPLTLASAGLVITFAAGLWNIGVEGQIVVGAIAASFVAREAPGGQAVLVPLTILAGMVGGVLWAVLVGVLKTRGRVNEIFGGLGLDFVASGLAIYLIIDPWKRAGIASTSGTDIFRREAWLPTLGTSRLSLVAVGLVIAAVVVVYVLMRWTAFGLRLRAVGRNPRSARLLGISPDRYVLAAFALCGALAGVAGTVQATGTQHKLVPAISGNYGFLGILVVLLAGFRASLVAPIALFLVAISVGSTQLPLRLNLDSAVGGILQGTLVLFVLLARGVQLRRAERSQEAAAASETARELERKATLTEEG